MRISLAALLVLVAACGSSQQPLVEADAQTADASVDGAGLVDAGEVPDEGTLDAGMPWDAGVDAGMRDAGTDDMGYVGECSLVPQSGCADGEACRLTNPGASLSSECGPVRVDPIGEGMRCLVAEDCAAGFQCEGECVRLCVVGMPCPDLVAPGRVIRMVCVANHPPVGWCSPR